MTWSPADPGQGDPDGIETLALLLGDVADAAADAQTNLQRLKDRTTDAIWRGAAAEAFRNRVDKLPVHLAALAASYADARDGFTRYAAEVGDLQHRQQAAEREIASATSDHSAAATAHLEYAAAAPATPIANPYDEAVAAAKARLASASGKLGELADDRRTADTRVKGSLRTAHQAGMKNKSGWNRFWHDLSNVLAVVAVVLIVVAVVAVIIAFPAAIAAFAAADGLLAGLATGGAVLGEAAGGGALGLAITGVGVASLGTETALYTEGEGSGRRLAFDAALTLSPFALAKGTRYLADAANAVRAVRTTRTFTSNDPLVGDVANAIETAMPGRIIDVNTNVFMFNGKSREIDIDLGTVYIQVKSGAARGLLGQLRYTMDSTGVPSVGYGPTMPGAAWLHAAREGVSIARDLPELIAILKELG